MMYGQLFILLSLSLSLSLLIVADFWMEKPSETFFYTLRTIFWQTFFSRAIRSIFHPFLSLSPPVKSVFKLRERARESQNAFSRERERQEKREREKIARTRSENSRDARAVDSIRRSRRASPAPAESGGSGGIPAIPRTDYRGNWSNYAITRRRASHPRSVWC